MLWGSSCVPECGRLCAPRAVVGGVRSARCGYRLVSPLISSTCFLVDSPMSYRINDQFLARHLGSVSEICPDVKLGRLGRPRAVVQAARVLSASVTLGAGASGTMEAGPFEGPGVVREIVTNFLGQVVGVPSTGTYQLWLSESSGADTAPLVGDEEITRGRTTVIVSGNVTVLTLAKEVEWNRGRFFVHMSVTGPVGFGSQWTVTGRVGGTA